MVVGGPLGLVGSGFCNGFNGLVVGWPERLVGSHLIKKCRLGGVKRNPTVSGPLSGPLGLVGSGFCSGFNGLVVGGPLGLVGSGF